MPPIRKGDGTPVTPKGISQIRTGDGRILFDGVAIPDTVVSRPDDDNNASVTDSFGLVIKPSSTFNSVGVEISNNTSNATRARLYDFESDIYIATEDISGFSSGDAFKINQEIEEAKEYAIELDANGSSYTLGFRDNEQNFPYTGDEIDIVAASSEGSQSTSSFDVQAVNNVGNPQDILD